MYHKKQKINKIRKNKNHVLPILGEGKQGDKQ